MQTFRLLFASLRRRTLCIGVLAVVAAGLASSAPLATGTVRTLDVDSASLGGKLSVAVYVPGTTAPPNGWPVLYLLHGLGGCEDDWLQLGSIRGTLDRLIGAGRIRPMMVVMPGAGSSWYVDSGRFGGPGNYESAIGDDLPRAIEKSFPVAETADLRAIAGVSMGGYGALRIALDRPDRYSSVASMSGAIWQNLQEADKAAAGVAYNTFRDRTYFRRVDDATIAPGVDLPPEGSHFGTAFGAPFSSERFNSENVFTLLARQVAKGAALPPIYLTVGDHDSHNLWRGSIALYQTLMAERQSVEFRVTDGDHTWALWKKSIEDTLIFVDQHFGRRPGGVIADAGVKAAS